MFRFSFYISKSKDPDLCGLLNDVGTKRFRKVARLCLRGLFDKESVKEALEYSKKNLVEAKKDPPKDENGYYRIRVTINGKKDGEVESLMESVKQSQRSIFIKNTIRQVLGPQTLVKYFFDEDSLGFFAENVYVPLKTINIEGRINYIPAAQQNNIPNMNIGEQNMNIIEQNTAEESRSCIGNVEKNYEPVNRVIGEEIKDSSSLSVLNQNELGNAMPVSNVSEVVDDEAGAEEDFDILSMLEAML